MASSETPTLEVTDLPRLALPIVDLIADKQPDIIIGCDRGARLFTLAVKAMWRELHQKPLPTLDHTIRFTRVKSNYTGRKMLKKDLTDIFQSYSEPINELVGERALRMLFIDDWMQTGAGRDAITDTLSGMPYDITPYFGMMIGTKGDAIGKQIDQLDVDVSFKDNSKQLGIDYKWHGGADQTPFAVRHPDALESRRSLYEAARILGATIRQTTAEEQGLTEIESQISLRA
ncbi:MAG TPA: hypothetical protein VGE34_00415 [Candidatus Saccharimonadales bacterium]